jgi:hypothetical protein
MRLKMDEREQANNVRNLASAIRICRMAPGPWDDTKVVPNAERIAQAVVAAPESQWRSWRDDPPSPDDGPIVGRDMLGFVHVATHLIGGRGMWADHWMRVPFDP